MVINPIVEVYIPIIRIRIPYFLVGGLPSPRTKELIDPGSGSFSRKTVGIQQKFSCHLAVDIFELRAIAIKIHHQVVKTIYK